MTHVHVFDFGNPLERSGGPVVDQALVFQMLVEELVQTAVRGFLTDEAFELVGKLTLMLGGEFFLRAAQAVNEELFTHGKAHGQGIHESRSERVAPIPTQGKGLFQINQQLAHNKMTHGD
jgi:hypothetical protein